MANPHTAGVKETPTTALPGATTITPGQTFLVNGVPVVVPPGQASISAWAATIGGSPVIAACDVPARTHGAFLPANHPANMDLLGNKGLPIFEV